MKITAFCTLALLGGCAYTPPPGYTDSEVGSCKGTANMETAATLALVVLAGPFGGVFANAPSHTQNVDRCLTGLHQASYSQPPMWAPEETGGGTNLPATGGNVAATPKQ